MPFPRYLRVTVIWLLLSVPCILWGQTFYLVPDVEVPKEGITSEALYRRAEINAVSDHSSEERMYANLKHCVFLTRSFVTSLLAEKRVSIRTIVGDGVFLYPKDMTDELREFSEATLSIAVSESPRGVLRIEAPVSNSGIEIERYAKVLHSSHQISRGDVIGPGDVYYKIVSISPQFEEYYLYEEGRSIPVFGFTARGLIPVGSIITREKIESPQYVRAGREITVQYLKGAVHITSKGRALSSGRQGDTVRVRTNTPGSVFDAQVVGENEVLINANSN